VSALSELSGRPSRTVIARALLAVVAVLLIAWFSVLARNYSLGTDAADRVVSDPEMSAAEWADVMYDFDRARLLDPSTDWSLVAAQYQLLRDDRAALMLAEDVLRREPDNLSAWWVVVRAARDIDPARWREANAAIARLNPTPAAR
jgi:hypothetical protein